MFRFAGIIILACPLLSTPVFSQTLTKIEVTVSSAVVVDGPPVPITVKETFQDDTGVETSKMVTSGLTWTSDDKGTKVHIDSSTQIVTGIDAGSTRIYAQDPAFPSSLVSGNARLVVTSAPLPSAISVTSPIKISVGQTIIPTVLGDFTSGGVTTRHPISKGVTLTEAADTSLAKVDTTSGKITGIAVGSTTTTIHVGTLPAATVVIKVSPANEDSEALGDTKNFLYSFVGGAEQVGLVSQPSETEPFVRVFLQSGSIGGFEKHTFGTSRLWASIRLLGTPTQSDTTGIFTVFTDPTGQITAEKLSSVGTGMDFALGYAFRVSPSWTDTHNSVDAIIGFGGTKPFTSGTVAEAFAVPVFGTTECRTLTQKITQAFYVPALGQVAASLDGSATNSSGATNISNACLINKAAATTTTANGATQTTYAPVSTIAFSNADRTSFLLKDMVGVRFNHTAKADKHKDCGSGDGMTACDLGQLDFTFGNDAAVTGGVLRGSRWVFKTEGVYPLIVQNATTIYLFGSFATRLARNETNNVPLILQSTAVSTLGSGGMNPVPNVNTLVLPLQQPDRDFYRIGIGIDILGLIKKISK